ncbi:hypothetical protein EVAR_26784_1 [Eumeta japonica]|uniref:Uncharacterized protein n=1 Tax=Eumeta variegata TaxID=151549 RepID=A0A4C1XFB1_EUMVA|nr:hypothetical protein EVAR_26784_1 [Eumeta japonica]
MLCQRIGGWDLYGGNKKKIVKIWYDLYDWYDLQRRTQDGHQHSFCSSGAGVGSDSGIRIDINKRTIIEIRIDNENG